MIDTLDTEQLQDLADLIDEAMVELGKYFPGCETRLIGYCDPESGDTSMVLYVNSPYDAQESIRRRDEFDENWWYTNCTRAGYNLCVDLTFN